MTLDEFIKNHFPKYQSMQIVTDPYQKKVSIKNTLFSVKETLVTNLLKKIKTGKINQEHNQHLMDFLTLLIKEHNQIQIYDVKNDIVSPRDIRTFPEVVLVKDLNKGNCQKNLDQLELLKYLI